MEKIMYCLERFFESGIKYVALILLVIELVSNIIKANFLGTVFFMALVTIMVTCCVIENDGKEREDNDQ